MENQRSYRLERRIGQGGMAHVFEAIAESAGGFQRRVAVKRMLPDLSADARLRTMFEDEAKIASHLHHGGIVQVIDYGFAEEDAFLVLEFVEGIDARSAVRRNVAKGAPMPVSVACHVLSEVAHALAYVHEAKGPRGEALDIVHRDVSPANVLLSWEGDVKLSDFGIAKAAVRASEGTESGQVRGKLSFMAPEQLRGESVGPSADVYALGVSLSALLGSGVPPIRGPQALQRHADRAPFPSVPHAPAELTALIEACTRLEPSERPSAGEVAAAIEAHASRHQGPKGRTALKGWLAGLREPEARASLDQLVDLVLVSDPGVAGRFTVTRPARPEPAPTPALAPPEASPVADPGAQTEPATPVSPVAPRRVPWVALGLAASVLVGGVGIGVALFGAGDEVHESTGPRRPPPVRPSPEVDLPPPEVPSGTVAVPEVEPPPEPSPAVEPAAPPALTSEVAPRVRRGRRAPVAQVRAPEPPPTSARGSLRVGGRPGSVVWLDGREMGEVPLVRSVALGRHVLVVRSAEGQEILRRSIELGPQHTAARPLVVAR